ncbi:MAG: collagen-like protein [Leptolyngbyaceae cyanobacterium SL_7_1]|nr:collagen-like protein [Leptolyngbyaceae cyanobacterium SL_7_1]
MKELLIANRSPHSPHEDFYVSPSPQTYSCSNCLCGKDLIQVGRDYIRYISFNFETGNWGVAIANLLILSLIAYGLVNGLLSGASAVAERIAPEPIPPLPGDDCVVVNETLEKLDSKIDRIDSRVRSIRVIPGPQGERGEPGLRGIPGEQGDQGNSRRAGSTGESQDRPDLKENQEHRESQEHREKQPTFISIHQVPNRPIMGDRTNH